MHPIIVSEGDPAVSRDSSPRVMGFIPLCQGILRKKNENFHYVHTKVKIRKNYIVGEIFKIPYSGRKLPVTRRDLSCQDVSLRVTGKAVQPLT